MRADTIDRRGRLLLWVSFSLGIGLRDLWLAAHGGGSTLRWMLRAETAAFGLSALGGVVALRSRPDNGSTVEAATAAVGLAAVAMHTVRLVVYLKCRPKL